MKRDYCPRKPKKFLPWFGTDLQQITLNIIALRCVFMSESISYLFLIPSSLSPIAVYLVPRACLYRSTLTTSPWSRRPLSKSLSASRLISSKFGFWLWTFLLRSWLGAKWVKRKQGEGSNNWMLLAHESINIKNSINKICLLLPAYLA